MIHFDEKAGTYTLKVQGAEIHFYTLIDMINFAKFRYGLNLLTQLN